MAAIASSGHSEHDDEEKEDEIVLDKIPEEIVIAHHDETDVRRAQTLRDQSKDRAQRRLHFLVHGFIRNSQRIHHFLFFPSELVRTVFDHYCSFHLEWMERNITLQIVNGNEGDDENVYFGAQYGYHYQSPDRGTISAVSLGTDFSSEMDRRTYGYNHHGGHSCLWRIYPLSTGGFNLRPVNPSQCVDAAEYAQRQLFGHGVTHYLAPRGGDKRDQALSLQLVRPDEGGDDEYHFMNLDDGKYLAVKYDHERIVRLHRGCPLYHDPSRTFLPLRSYGDEVPEPSMHFKDSPSEGTLFRIKEYPFIRERGFELEIGSRVHYRVWGFDEPDHWISARVIAAKYSAFGKEVKLKYGGYCCTYGDIIYRREGVTDWIPALSPDIKRYGSEADHNRQRLLAEQFVAEQFEIFWKKWEKEFECNVCDPNMMDDERYKKRVKSRKMRKSKKKKRGHYRDWNVDDKGSLKRIERKSRKYGRIPKYPLCF